MVRRVTHLILWLAGLSAVFAAATASAATLGGLLAPAISAGEAVVQGCDASMGLVYTTSGGDVTAVTVSGIADPACSGGVLSLVVLDANGTAIASAAPVAVPSDAGTADDVVTVAVSPHPPAELVEGVALQVLGP
jgi:hypothetical protein